MTASTRVIAAVVLVGVWTTGLLLAQAPAPAPQPQTPAAPAGGRGRQAGPAARGGFEQFTRPLASQDVIVRGKGLYEANCASCHVVDLRGTADGKNPNLLRSGVALRDQKGELIASAIGTHRPALTLVATDTVAIAEYIHSVHAKMGRAGRPPESSPTLNVLVGDPKAGEAQFGTLCASCHSVAGNLKGIGAKFPDARDLQSAWITGSSSTFGGGGRGGGGTGNPVTVTMADGSKLEGTLVRKNEFIVILMLADGTRKSIARQDGIPKVDVKDPQAAHKAMALKLAFDDPDNKKMHDITAYLATIK